MRIILLCFNTDDGVPYPPPRFPLKHLDVATVSSTNSDRLCDKINRESEPPLEYCDSEPDKKLKLYV